jgi:5-amino-6-(5-phosphoribosylamino)uracil reductase
MRQLLPFPLDEIDLGVLDDRSDRAGGDRPWVMANMVMSVDGAYAVQGRSGGLGSPGDRRVFHRLRAATDVVLVAAGTARAERYRRPRTPPELLGTRRSAGLADDPRLVVVSASLHLPEDLPLLDGDGQVPLVVHPGGADTTKVPPGVDLRAVGEGQVDLRAVVEGLGRDGAGLVLCEGGPSLLGALHELDLIDELFVTVSPSLVGGDRVGLLSPTPARLRPLHLHRLLEEDGSLFATYRVDRTVS